MAGNSNSGRKRHSFVTDALVMEMKAREGKGDKRGVRAVAAKIWDEAEKGERWAAEFIRDTIDGKPPQQIIQSGDPDNPLEHKVSLDVERFTGSIARLASRTAKAKGN